ncbi:hypothetical protein SOASR030_01860 [Leminorella grimontii]|uniref:Uncharacterized protein n=1 Tax=Leminorella grimontii TaxID=82981 RepID=A0AAV5MZ61_9GAMM|nr:hypothetical protein [Leminorella grimontii]GKX54074.1 hypothetical protein SOASR030_01860 [Leminorella grimontii]
MRKIIAIKARRPSARGAIEREIIKTTSDLFKTVGAIRRQDVAASGIFSKGRSHVLDKLVFFSVSRYLLLKFYKLFFRLGQFFLGRFVGFQNYVHLLIDEGNPLSKDFVALNCGKGADGIFNGGDEESNVHGKPFKQIKVKEKP